MNSTSAIHRIKNYTYLTEDLLGEGSTGKVYMGANERTQQKVAIKVINMKQIDNEVTSYLLNCQKQALTCILHPHVLHAFDIIQQQQYCYIITQFCPEGTLKEYIRRKKNLNQQQAINIFGKLVNGYQAIKQKHFVHRDLKSANIMLKNNEPIIIDFGYCEKTYGTKPRIFYNVGSPSYMSPEAYYRTTYSEKSDIWALGVILYEMIQGNTIDYGKDINKYYKNLIKNGFSLQKPVSQGCLTLLKMCLQINHNNRVNCQSLLRKIQEINNCQNFKNRLKQPRSEEYQKKISIKQFKNKVFQNMQDNANRNSHPANILQKNHSNFIPMTESILRKPVSASLIQEPRRPLENNKKSFRPQHRPQYRQQYRPQYQGEKFVPLTPTINYNRQQSGNMLNNTKFPLQRLSNAQSVVSSSSYQTDRIKLSKNNKNAEQKNVQLKMENGAQNHKIMAQSLNIIPQASMELENGQQNGVNIFIPNRQNRNPQVFYSTFINDRNIHQCKPPHLSNQNFHQHNFQSQQNIQTQQKKQLNVASYRRIPDMEVPKSQSSFIAPREFQQPKLGVGNILQPPYKNHAFHPQNVAIHNSHNQFITNAHQAFTKKNVPFFENNPQVYINRQVHTVKNPQIRAPKFQSPPQIHSPQLPIQNNQFNQNLRLQSIQNGHNFHHPPLNQNQTTYILNQHGRRNYIVQPIKQNTAKYSFYQ